MILMSNNPKVLGLGQKYSKITKEQYIETLNIIDFFKAVRDKIHQGHKLLTHPLSGSVKPGETPFKSVLLSSEKADLDIDSLLMIEDAIAMAGKFVGEHNDYKWQSEEIVKDFSTIDYGLIEGALQSSNQF